MLKWIILYAAISCTAVYLYLDSITHDMSGWCSDWDVAYSGCVDVRDEM